MASIDGHSTAVHKFKFISLQYSKRHCTRVIWPRQHSFRSFQLFSCNFFSDQFLPILPEKEYSNEKNEECLTLSRLLKHIFPCIFYKITLNNMKNYCLTLNPGWGKGEGWFIFTMTTTFVFALKGVTGYVW